MCIVFNIQKYFTDKKIMIFLERLHCNQKERKSTKYMHIAIESSQSAARKFSIYRYSYNLQMNLVFSYMIFQWYSFLSKMYINNEIQTNIFIKILL